MYVPTIWHKLEIQHLISFQFAVFNKIIKIYKNFKLHNRWMEIKGRERSTLAVLKVRTSNLDIIFK